MNYIESWFPYEILWGNEKLENTNFKLGHFVPLINGRFVLFLNKGSLEEETWIKYGILWWTAHVLDEELLRNYLWEDSFNFFQKSKKDSDKKKKSKSNSRKWLEKKKKYYDFNIDISNTDVLDKLLSWVKHELLEAFEDTPIRELIEELSKEKIPWYQRTVLLPEDIARQISVSQIWSVYYPNKENKWLRKTHYYRTVWQWHCDRKTLFLLKKRSMRQNQTPPVLYFPTNEEMENGKTKDGIRISETALTLYSYLKNDMNLINK